MSSSRKPSLKLFDSSLAQFVLVSIGLTCIVVSLFNLPRHEETRQLESLHRERSLELEKLNRQSHELRRRTRAMREDPHYRRIMLERVTGSAFRESVTPEQLELMRQRGS